MILVTGASRGLGRTICERLVSSGTSVLGISRTEVDSNFPTVSCDVTSFEGLKAIANRLQREKAIVTGVINAAGVASMNLALTTPASTVRKIVEINLLGTIYSCQAFAPLLIRQRRGSIINFSSISVALAISGESVYSASKAGIESFSRGLARELGVFGVNVNCLAPGPIETDLLRGVSSTQIGNIVERQILRRQFTPEDVADLVEILLDPRFNSVSGQVIHVGGA